MNLLVLIAAISIFCFIAWAVRYHFQSQQPPAVFVALSVLSALNFFVFARELWLRPKPITQLVIALGLMIASAAMLVWSVQASRQARLKIIFDPDQPQFILRNGPYRYVRHPFYATYIIFWSACALATLHPINIAYAVLLVPLLTFAARGEERGFGNSPLASDYAEYRKSAGLFWPRL